MSKGMIDALWYLARGTGVVSLIMLTITVVLGIGSRSGRPVFGLPRFAVALVHRNASLIALGLIAIHVTSLLLDPYAQLRLVDLVVPFGATYRPLWVGLGTLAAEMLVVVVGTSLLRTRIGVRWWRSIHWIAYAMWPAAWLHGFYTGSDGGESWLNLVVIVCALAVGAAGIWRCLPDFEETSRTRVRPARDFSALRRFASRVTTRRAGGREPAPVARERTR
jgi:methionine sulfoxide reductase heme-binding subunit